MPKSEMVSWGELAKRAYLIIPLALLIFLVSSGSRTMQFSAAVSILAAIVVGFLNKDERLTFGKIVEALEAGAKGAITVAVACAMAGMIAGCITVTGLASILINAIVQMAGDATMIGLLLTMICCIILGMGVPTTANYCIMASTCAPILVQMGFPLVAAHFFVFYFGIVADITPPVALAAYAGAAIAKANPMKTGINATKLAIAAFIVPYIFAYSPAMLFDNVSSAFEVAAGRLHNKKNLMDELNKISRVIERELPDASKEILLVLDATTGQNAVNQAKDFKEAAGITGIVLTKLDGTAKGGVVLAINNELDVPVKFVGVGEKIEDLQPFDADAFAAGLFDAKIPDDDKEITDFIQHEDEADNKKSE